jgi:hypothetical protein
MVVQAMVQRIVIGATIFGATIALAGMAAPSAADDFPLVGNYTQNVACKGDGSDPAAVVVKISPQMIVSNLGTCNILDTTHDGNTFAVHVECKFASGPLMGNLTFTPLPDKTIAFVVRDGNYKAVLHPCPN